MSWVEWVLVAALPAVAYIILEDAYGSREPRRRGQEPDEHADVDNNPGV